MKDPQLGRRSREEEAAAVRVFAAGHAPTIVGAPILSSMMFAKRAKANNCSTQASAKKWRWQGRQYTHRAKWPLEHHRHFVPSTSSQSVTSLGQGRTPEAKPLKPYTRTFRSGQPLRLELAQMTRPADMIKTLEVAQAGCQQQACSSGTEVPRSVTRFRSHRRELLC